MNWKIVKVSDLGKVITGNTPPRKSPELYGEHTIFIKPTDISEQVKYTYSPEECYSELGFKQYKNSLIPKGATCVVTIGSIGKKITKAHRDCFINQAMNAVIPSENFDEEFVYYLLKYNLSRLKTLDSGTASGRENVSKSSFSSIRVSVPESKNTQIKIGKILSNYDDLIENNLKRIKLLEEMAQITYEEWFVRLRFPGYEFTPVNAESELPKGWTKTNLGSCFSHEIGGGWGEDELSDEFSKRAYVIRGTDMDGLTLGNFSNCPLRFHKKSNLSPRKLQHGDIIFEVSGGSQNEGVAKTSLITDSLLKLFESDVMCASFCKLARPNEDFLSVFLFHFLRFLRKTKATEVFEIRSASNIVNYNWTAFLKFQKVKIPPSGLLELFDNRTSTVHNQIYNLASQNQRLREARDILLPRLMTGVIDVESYNPPQLLKEAT